MGGLTISRPPKDGAIVHVSQGHARPKGLGFTSHVVQNFSCMAPRHRLLSQFVILTSKKPTSPPNPSEHCANLSGKLRQKAHDGPRTDLNLIFTHQDIVPDNAALTTKKDTILASDGTSDCVGGAARANHQAIGTQRTPQQYTWHKHKQQQARTTYFSSGLALPKK